MGSAREQVVPFTFDKVRCVRRCPRRLAPGLLTSLSCAGPQVFQPTSSQADVFEEISALTQSVLDGYNCCIFAYGELPDLRGPGLRWHRTESPPPPSSGQTGAGKSFTMEGGSVRSDFVSASTVSR